MNAQGEDVVAGIRTPLPIAELQHISPSSYTELVNIGQRLETALSGHAGCGVYDSRRSAIHATDPER